MPEGILSAQQFARFGAYIGWRQETLIAELQEFGLCPAGARQFACEAVRERQDLDAEERAELDARARASEFDLDAQLLPHSDLPHSVEAEQTVRDAFAAAMAVRGHLGLGPDELSVLLCGAFLLDVDTAFLIASAAVDELPTVQDGRA